MLIKAEPRLKTLLAEAKAVHDDKTKPSFCATHVWYRQGFREMVYYLVGWEAKKSLPDFMRTSEAFDLAYKKIYNALPDCRNCICM